MRFVVYGPGAVGGVVGGRLYQHGHEVVLIGRGAHYERIVADGLRLKDPSGEQLLRIDAVDHPSKIAWRDGDVVLVAVKSQHSPHVFAELAAVAPSALPIVCLQNGVRNEYEALRRFEHVYGVPVACPSVHLEPGVVEAYSSPVTGILDVGRYPAGRDATAVALSDAFSGSTFDSRAISDVARWKWRKLITNLGNAVEAVCGPAARGGSLGEHAASEGEACLMTAGIAPATREDDRARRGDILKLGSIADRARPGGSTWQSLARRTGAVETDYLNGEIVLLGRLHGIATPVNALLQRLANQLAVRADPPGSLTIEEFESMLQPS